MTIILKSRSFRSGAPIPSPFTRDREDISPALDWQNVPEGTKELAMVCLDTDAPGESPFVHWVQYSIPASITGLEHGQQDVGVPGLNSWGELGYGGPQPPQGDEPHHYAFHLYALDEQLNLERGLGHGELNEAMRGHVLDEGQLIGTFVNEAPPGERHHGNRESR